MDHWQMMAKGGFYRGGPALSGAVAGPDPERPQGPTRSGRRARPGAAAGPDPERSQGPTRSGRRATLRIPGDHG
ncbi:hypothetical protein EF902_26870 [Streptomyces sp. WAC05858]|nr:hypothetical protein EF902_26870 [Streptomyces sp. WAC05858]